MSGQIVHTEIPADDTAQGKAFWGSLFGWEFDEYPGPSEYHMARVSDTSGVAITNMEPGKNGMRSYFDVDDIDDGIARVNEARRRGRREDAGSRRWAGSRRAPTRTGTSSVSGRAIPAHRIHPAEPIGLSVRQPGRPRTGGRLPWRETPAQTMTPRGSLQ